MTDNPGPEETPSPQWDVPVPEGKKKKIPFWRPRPGQPAKLIVLSDSMLSVMKHYCARQSCPCTGRPETCEGCRCRWPKRWYGYLACMGQGDRLLCIAEITVGAVDTCPQLKNKKISLRGARLELRRSGQAQNSPVVAVLTPGGPNANLPDPFDLKEQLLLIWGTPSFRKADDNAEKAEQDARRQIEEDFYN